MLQRILLLLAATAAVTLAAPVATADLTIHDTREARAVSFTRRKDDEDDEDLEMGATPFGKRKEEDDDDEDLEMGATPFRRRGIYDKVDIEGFRRNHPAQPIEVKLDA